MIDRGQHIRTVHARTLYDGESIAPLADQVVTIENGFIAGIQPYADATMAMDDAITVDILAPGFIDMQINGAGGIQFNEQPTIEAMAGIAAGARQGGTAHLLPTFITAPDIDYRAAIDAANAAVASDIPGILGVHLEGPFLSKEKPGIHPSAYIRPMTRDDVNAVCQAKGTALLTLAPEEQNSALMRELRDRGVHLFAGHSNATAEQMQSGIEAGIRGVTHLFNSHSPILARDPGIVGAALMNQNLHAGIIADGIHVHPQNLAMAARLMGSRLCLVTDAMKTIASTVTTFDLYGTPITLNNDRLTGPDGTLAGAHLSMDQAVRNAIVMLDCAPAIALAMASTNPARALDLDNCLGRIKPNYCASFTCLSGDFQPVSTIVKGRLFAGSAP